MNAQAMLEWCRTRPGVTEETPFGPEATLVVDGLPRSVRESLRAQAAEGGDR